MKNKYFLAGLLTSICFTSVFSYFLVNVLRYYSIYSKDFSESKFYNDVHCGVSKGELRNILGEPFGINVIEDKGEEIWFYSRQRFSTDNYIIFSVTLYNDVVFDKRTELFVD